MVSELGSMRVVRAGASIRIHIFFAYTWGQFNRLKNHSKNRLRFQSDSVTSQLPIFGVFPVQEISNCFSNGFSSVFLANWIDPPSRVETSERTDACARSLRLSNQLRKFRGKSDFDQRKKHNMPNISRYLGSPLAVVSGSACWWLSMKSQTSAWKILLILAIVHDQINPHRSVRS